jgi:serine/threonine protein kinase
MSRDRRTPLGPSEDAGDTSDESFDSFMREAAQISEPAASEVPAAAPLRAGEIVGGRFKVERAAGRGGMGAVYRAEETATGQFVAIKVVARETRSFAERFLREAVVLAELSHPCIVRYVAHGMTPHGQPFLAMDWLEGEDLAERLARGVLGIEESFALVRRASEGLARAHAIGVVHRDLKPSNLFLVGGQATSVKVIDFGVARVDGGSTALTRPGSSLGTVGYMAPEQATEAADVDARADVYALGCVLFECMTGRTPFTGRPTAQLVKLLAQVPPAPSSLRPGIAPAVDALVARLLAKNRDERPRDAAELLEAIDALGLTLPGP